jgi:Ca2+-binding RTX toxin-like protein
MLAAVIGAAPEVAAASTIRVDPTANAAVLIGGPAANDVSNDVRHPLGESPPPFDWLYGRQPFTDSAQHLSAGAGCVAGVPVWCQSYNSQVDLGGGNDRYDGWNVGWIHVSGGTGDDYIVGNGEQTVVSGGAGMDTIAVGSNGGAVANGDAGDDNIRSIPGGSVAFLNGGSGKDLAFGERSVNRISGGAGNDDLVVARGYGSVAGEAGNDTIVVLLPGDKFGSGRALSGGDGDDTIVGGPGAETVSGGDANDSIDVSRGDEVDTVDCGPGYDVVYAGADDVIADNCETRVGGSMPTAGPVDAALARLSATFGVVSTPAI